MNFIKRTQLVNSFRGSLLSFNPRACPYTPAYLTNSCQSRSSCHTASRRPARLLYNKDLTTNQSQLARGSLTRSGTPVTIATRGIVTGPGQRPLWKKLLMLWSGAFLAMGVVVCVNYKLYVEKTTPAERKKRLERVKDDPSVMNFFLTIPCMRNTLILAIVSSLSSWVTVFLFTSTVMKANKAMVLAPCIVAPTFLLYCMTVTEKERKETEQVSSALKDLQRYKKPQDNKDLPETKDI